jgi:hypothetical protein
MSLPRTIGADWSEARRARWRIIRLDTHETLPGRIILADVDNGTAIMCVRGPDSLAEDGSVVATWVQATYNLGPGGIAIVAR